ncbi:LysR family transcriptional regulator [Rhizobium sullae]|uniref:HTH-type transcriptional regulator TtuA n=1 Tax=Rhizobium sullae TaxID=50338 RepID=A0A2N0DFJ3_RHISU|nr:LysR family transcriptional regulator [Rhizobium sullae]PKA44869.1 LysR family transcriptional regulator [Rhizobium sullae]
MMTSLLHMRHFIAVAEELHFGRAAARLGMAQPPLSQSIKRLEERLGFPLFERTQRAVRLTAAGRVFLEEARRTIAQSEDAVRLARRAASDDLAQISIAFVSAALYRLLPQAIRAFHEIWPDTTIRLDERPTEAQLAGLAGGDIDLGFFHPPIKTVDGLAVELIHRDKLIVAVPSHHPLAALNFCRLADLAGHDFIMFPHQQGPTLHGKITNACRAAGFVPNIVQEARQMHTILSLVAAGLGVSLVPTGATTMRIAGVAFIPLVDTPADIAWEMAIGWQPRGARKALRNFLEVVRTVGQKLKSEM